MFFLAQATNTHMTLSQQLTVLARQADAGVRAAERTQVAADEGTALLQEVHAVAPGAAR